MERLSILVGRFNKLVALPKYLFKVQQIGRFMPLVGAIHRSVEPPLDTCVDTSLSTPLSVGVIFGVLR